jgi:4-hydroxy-tetrahydrodipicolinate synthase
MFEGIITALITPFHADYSLNLGLMPRLIERQIEGGVTAICVTAGAGEYLTLRSEERREVIRRAGDVLQGRIPLIAGILGADTGSAVKASQVAREAGAQALLVLNPLYLAPSLGGLLGYFRAVAQEVDLPIIVYNNPGRTGVNLDLPILERLADIPQVVALKECDRDLGRVAVKIERLGSRLAFLSGDDDLCLPSFAIGATGAIMAASNLVPSWPVGILKAVQKSEWDEARALFSRLLKIVALYVGPDHPGPLKQIMGRAGFPVGIGRPPLHPVSAERLAYIDQVLRELGLLADTYL